MKICFYCPDFSYNSGVGTYSVDLVKRLAKRNQVTVVTANYAVRIEGVDTITYQVPLVPEFAKIRAHYQKATEIINQNRDRFDIVHTDAGSFNQDVITCHGLYRYWVEKQRQLSPVRNALTRIHPTSNLLLDYEKKIYTRKLYKKIIAPSNGTKRDLANFYNVPSDEVEVILPGIDTKRFAPDKKSGKALREELGLEGTVLLFTGYDFKRKGLEFVIRSMTKIKDSTLLVAGRDRNEGKYRALARKLGLENRIVFLGFIKRMEEIYKAGDIYVFPTFHESFAATTLEAAASGLPIVATKINGTEELIKEGYNGYFVKQNPDEIASRVNKIIEKGAASMGRNSRMQAKKFNWDTTARKITKLYEGIL